VLQLWPLAALWLATAFAIFHKCRNSGSKWLGRPLLKAAAMAAIFALFALPAVFAITPRSPIGANKNGLMAGYFRGLEPSELAPHLVRVDPQISFRDVAEMGALPAPSHVIWRGRLIVPRDGRYRFMLDADDSGWLRLDGTPVISEPNAQNSPHGIAEVYLTAGTHRIEAGELNIWGDASATLSWQVPGSPPRPIPASALLPPAL